MIKLIKWMNRRLKKKKKVKKNQIQFKKKNGKDNKAKNFCFIITNVNSQKEE